MPGRREHHIPQALLRGFANSTGKRWNVWTYRKDGGRAFNANIKNVGVEVDFYTSSDDDPFDRSMNRLEGDYGAMLAKIRSGVDITAHDQEVAKRFLAHCLVRTARIRSLMGDMARKGREFLERLAGDTALIRDAFVGAYSGGVGEDRILEQLRAECKKRGRDIPDAVLRPMIRQRMSEVLGDIDTHANAMTVLTKRGFEQAAARWDFNSRSMHMRALEKSGLEPQTRVEHIEAQPFGLAHLTGGKLLLGDCVVIGIGQDRTAVDSLTPVDELAGWIMPLTAEIFAYSGSTDLASKGASFINDASIGLSTQFFLSKDRSDEFQMRVSEIGTLPNIVQKTPWNEIYASVEKDAREGKLHHAQIEGG